MCNIKWLTARPKSELFTPELSVSFSKWSFILTHDNSAQRQEALINIFLECFSKVN